MEAMNDPKAPAWREETGDGRARTLARRAACCIAAIAGACAGSPGTPGETKEELVRRVQMLDGQLRTARAEADALRAEVMAARMNRMHAWKFEPGGGELTTIVVESGVPADGVGRRLAEAVTRGTFAMHACDSAFSGLHLPVVARNGTLTIAADTAGVTLRADGSPWAGTITWIAREIEVRDGRGAMQLCFDATLVVPNKRAGADERLRLRWLPDAPRSDSEPLRGKLLVLDDANRPKEIGWLTAMPWPEAK